ncbi:MAG: hypothetical protein WDN49_24225 [Acetobacteraceae bacterium]
MVAEICRRLDGIPLALEFAAARVADLGLRNIVEQLDDRFSILTRGPRTALPRHRTLLATLDWSYRLLSADEQRMLCHLADHQGSFTTEHAHIVGGRAGCEQPPEALRGLYEKSLVSVDMEDDRPTYRLLDTTRAYILSLSAIERVSVDSEPARSNAQTFKLRLARSIAKMCASEIRSSLVSDLGANIHHALPVGGGILWFSSCQESWPGFVQSKPDRRPSRVTSFLQKFIKRTTHRPSPRGRGS